MAYPENKAGHRILPQKFSVFAEKDTREHEGRSPSRIPGRVGVNRSVLHGGKTKGTFRLAPEVQVQIECRRVAQQQIVLHIDLLHGLG